MSDKALTLEQKVAAAKRKGEEMKAKAAAKRAAAAAAAPAPAAPPTMPCDRLLAAPEVVQMVAAARQDPASVAPLLQGIQASNPQLLQLIQENPADFAAILNGTMTAPVASASSAAAPVEPDAIFLPGEHSVILIDWDDTLFPTSVWKGRIGPDAERPLRASKVATISAAIRDFVRTLQAHGEVKIVTHGTRGWFEKSSAVLTTETRELLGSLPARYAEIISPRSYLGVVNVVSRRGSTYGGAHLSRRYRDSFGAKYMTKKGAPYITDIGSKVDNYAEWYKCDMFFQFISERKQARKWDETHLGEKVILPKQVLVIGDGSAEKRSYDELGNQAKLYASRPGHAAVANVHRDLPRRDHAEITPRSRRDHAEIAVQRVSISGRG